MTIPDETPGTQPQSKSARKREHLARQSLAAALVGLTPGQRGSLPLDDALLDAVEAAGRMRGGAYRRQIRYVARLLGEGDGDAVRAAVEALGRARAADTAGVRRAERWRERLIEEGDAALEALVAEYPSADRQHLRRAQRAARAEREKGRPAGAARALYRALRDLAVAADPED